MEVRDPRSIGAVTWRATLRDQMPTESIDLHVVGDLALCEQRICSPAKQASCKQYT